TWMRRAILRRCGMCWHVRHPTRPRMPPRRERRWRRCGRGRRPEQPPSPDRREPRMPRHEVSPVRLPYRALALTGMALVALPLYERIRAVAESIGRQGSLFLWPELSVTLVAVAAAGLVLRGGTPEGAMRRSVELGLIVSGGLAFRLIFATAPPTLS